jgi:hypothetical protein
MPTQTSQALTLDEPRTWPRHITEMLESPRVTGLLRRREWMDEVAREPVLQPVFEAVEAHAAAAGLTGFHGTKQLPDRQFSETGLRILNFDEHHSYFRDLIQGRPDVPPKLFRHILRRLNEWRAGESETREKMLWFCFTRAPIAGSGAEEFFQMFGGEAIYTPFLEDSRVRPLLESLGEPVVVEARISTRDLTVYQEFALGRTLVSYYAQSVNPNFNLEEREGHVSRGVAPENVVAVHPHRKFVTARARRGRK